MSSYPRAHLSPAKAQDAHSISLKVLRLSRPTLATQTTLPATSFGNGLDIPPQASRAYPSPDETSPQLGAEFPLTPLLTLPAAFGAAYIGEAFTCTLCANNELDANGMRTVSGVRIVAELQTPSIPAGTALELKDGAGVDPTSGDAGEDGRDVLPGETLQKTLRHELKEEGPHVLAVTVSYTETMQSGSGGASGGRARTFRKLYQFVAQQAIAVRSKVTERRRRVAEEGEEREWVLEAQLENVGDSSVVMEKVWLNTRDGIHGSTVKGKEEQEGIVLKPQDVEQVMFLLSAKGEILQDAAASAAAGRLALAQLNIDWRSAMGERGSLTTGWLASRAR